MNEEQDFLYDDDEAIKFIRNYLPQELKEKFSDDDINYIIDLIYEFYESKGLFESEDDDDEDEKIVEFEEDELIGFVIKNAKTDGVGKFNPDEISFIVQGELEYCDSIDMFEE
jgi:DNA polymerase III delta subunit